MPSKYDKSDYKPYMLDGITPRCQGTVRKEGQEPRQCRNVSNSGWTVCRTHGAGSYDRPGGRPPNPEARYSRLVPKRLRSRFTQMMDDPHMLDFRPDIALLHIRVEELLTRLEENALNLEGLEDAVNLMDKGLKTQNVPMILDGFQGVKNAMNAESETRYIWKEVRELLQERKGLVQAEHSRLMDSQMMMSVDEVIALMAQIRRVLLENVSDMQTRINIATTIDRLADAGKEPIRIQS